MLIADADGLIIPAKAQTRKTGFDRGVINLGYTESDIEGMRNILIGGLSLSGDNGSLTHGIEILYTASRSQDCGSVSFHTAVKVRA